MVLLYPVPPGSAVLVDRRPAGVRSTRDACLISRGYLVSYNSNGGGVEVRSKAEPRQTVEVVARDLKACNDESGMGYVGRLQFRRCMDPRGYTVTSRD
jgi:hypothetical protein